MPRTAQELLARISQLDHEIQNPAAPLPKPSFYQPSASSSSSSIAMVGPVVRPKIAEMSSEVRDDNPYSRLMALKRMGIVDDYEKIRTFR